MGTENLAALFFHIAQKYNWPETSMIPQDEEQVLLDVVSAAGFEPKKIVVEKLYQYCIGRKGPSPLPFFPINYFCPYQVLDKKGESDYQATGWLNQLLFFASREFADKESAKKRIEHEIWRSIPFKPIIFLTANNALLREPRPQMSGPDFFVSHIKDTQNLSFGIVGIHDRCEGQMERVRESNTHDALHCLRCGLQVAFLRTVVTFGDLRKAMPGNFDIPLP